MQVHNQLSKGDLSSALRNATGGRDGGIERFGETLDPVINLWGMPEWAYLRAEGLCAFTRFSAANAANYSGVALVNPQNSGMIVVVEAATAKIAATVDAIAYLHLDADLLVALASSSFGHRRDRRLGPPTGVSRSIIRYGNAAAVPTGTGLEANATASITMQAFACCPVILRPGDAFALWGGSINNALTGNFVWRERAAYRGELV